MQSTRPNIVHQPYLAASECYLIGAWQLAFCNLRQAAKSGRLSSSWRGLVVYDMSVGKRTIPFLFTSEMFKTDDEGLAEWVGFLDFK